MNSLLVTVALFALAIISKLSYAGIIVLMALESCNIPIPSELIMPFAGYLVSQGGMNIHIAAFCGAIGCVIGSLASYALGYYGGRPILEKYGKYLLLTRHDLELGDSLFLKYGDKIALASRVLPIVRTFISFPAGVARMNLAKFAAYTFIGSLIWSYLLAFIGEKIGKNQALLIPYFHKFDLVIEILIVLGVLYYIYSHVKKLKAETETKPE